MKKGSIKSNFSKLTKILIFLLLELLGTVWKYKVGVKSLIVQLMPLHGRIEFGIKHDELLKASLQPQCCYHCVTQ